MGTKSVAISDKAYSNLEGLRRPRESFSDVILRIGSNASSRRSTVRRVCFVLWGYCFAFWLYVIAYQIASGDITDPLAWWLPIRMDYLGEAAFVLSLVFALVVASYRAAER